MKIKKIYCSPELMVTSLDRNISLSMTTEYTPPGDIPLGSAVQGTTQVSEVEKSSFEENPFKK